MRPGIAVAFLPPGTDHRIGDFGPEALTQFFLPILLDDPVFAGMEGQYHSSSARNQRNGKFLHKFCQNLKFRIHIDANGLKNSGTGFPDDFLLFLHREGADFLF